MFPHPSTSKLLKAWTKYHHKLVEEDIGDIPPSVNVKLVKESLRANKIVKGGLSNKQTVFINKVHSKIIKSKNYF